MQAVLCVDLVVVVSVCAALIVEKATVAAFTVPSAVLWVLAVAVGGGGVKDYKEGVSNHHPPPLKKDRTKFTVTVYSDSVQ